MSSKFGTLQTQMKAQQKLKIIGIIALILGTSAALLCLFPSGIMWALPLGFFGMISSSIYIFIDTKEEINKRKITPGIISMLLSSVPVLLILVVTVLHQLKN